MDKYFCADTDTYLIINSGAMVLNDRYDQFATYISSRHINVVTYNYTDVGTPLTCLKNSKISIMNWAKCDFKRIIDLITAINYDAKIFVLGHSLGGQIIGLTEDCKRINGIILVATQTGYWKYWSFPLNILNYLLWNAYIPFLVRIYNFLPKWNNGKLTSMPKTAALEWVKWCKSENYLFDHVPDNEHYYDKIACPLFSVSFDNDIYATKQAVDWFTAQYKNAKVLRKHYYSPNIKFGHSAAFEPLNFESITGAILKTIEHKS